MKISESQLKAKLNKEHFDVFIILGDEPVRIQEQANEIINHFIKEGFSSKETYLVTPNMDWSFLLESKENMDLFSNKKIIEIKMIDQGPGNKGAKAIKNYLSVDREDLLLVSVEGLDKRGKSSAWVKTLESNGLMVDLQPISGKSLLKWIKEKGSEVKINIEEQAGELLMQKTESNLMATSQEIKKLSLLYPGESISLGKMEESISNASKYSIFDFSKAFVGKDKIRCLKILEHLRMEGTPETLVLWSLARELSNLHKIQSSGSSNGIWGPNFYISSLEKTSRTTTRKTIDNSLKKIALIDSSIKGQNNNNPWMEIRELAINFVN